MSVLYLSEPCIRVRCEFVQLFLDGIAYIERVDKSAYGLGIDGGVGAGESFQCLVGLGIAFAAQNGLYALGHNIPHVVEVAVYRRTVEQ